MTILDLRQHTGYLLAAIVVGHVILISTQVTSRTGVPVLAEVTFGVFSQVQRGTAAVVDGAEQVWRNYAALRGVRSDNRMLREELATARVQLQEQRALAERSRTLEQLLGLRDRSNLSMAAADVIAAGATPDFRTVTIDRGTLGGLHRDMAVIAPGGVVGRVVMSGLNASQVQLLIDRNAAAGALIERSRAQGVIMGGDNGQLRMQYVAETADVKVGDEVVTSGIDGIYPKGFVIGRVTRVEHGVGGYRLIAVAPAVDFHSLEEVMVITTPPPSRDTGAAHE
ncbi:MAG: rod shape-determining protein MreC [Acidobacteriota bacterium]|nr:rod shape-determining protein MreC [Acidobacteriota bacterium]